MIVVPRKERGSSHRMETARIGVPRSAAQEYGSGHIYLTSV